jgi:putative transposase
MTYARAHLVDSDNGGFYHCISRCVRRGWLCGEDIVSGRSYEHRRAWVEARILLLAEIFAIEVFGYAVMSNHYHLVVEVEPHRVALWSDEEVVQRWSRLSPTHTAGTDDIRASTKSLDTKRISRIRERLSSLSWFMRYLNEPIARQANREDGCTGRFWE